MTSTERVVVALVALAMPCVGRAQGREDEVRRRLIVQAGTLRDRGDHRGALARLREAAERRMTPSLRLAIAQEERSLEMTLEALGDARQCAEEFELDPSLSHRDEFMASCRALASELQQQVARLTVRVPAYTPQNVAVTLDGEPVPREAWGRPRDVLPGTVVVTARAPGRAPFERTLTLTAGASSTVLVELDRAPEVDTPRPPRDPVDDPTPDPTPPSTSSSPTGRWVLLGVGGAGLAAAGVFWALQSSAVADRDALCRAPTGDCVVADASAAQAAADHQSRASTFNTAATVGLAVGGAAVLGGIVWWVIDASRASPRRSTGRVTPTGAGLRVAF